MYEQEQSHASIKTCGRFRHRQTSPASPSAPYPNYLNYPERVSDTLKEKIGASIKELGYTPRRNTLLPQRENAGPRLIGYIMTDIEHSLFTFIHEGAQEVCEEKRPAAYRLERIIRRATAKRTGENTHRHERGRNSAQHHIRLPRRRGRGTSGQHPIILLDHTNPRHADQVCCVLENNMAAGQIAADELIRIGCSRIAFAAHSFDYESVQDRQMGVEKTIARTHGSTQLELINSKGLMFEDGYQLGLDIIDTMKRSGLDAIPDGIITVSDALAAGVLSAFHDHNGPRVPEDVCVIGMEGARLETKCPMSLTVVNAPAIDMGRKAMAQMLDYIDNPAAHVHSTTLIEPTLIRRESTRA